MDKLVLIDGHSILNRAFYGMPDLTNAAGLHTGAVYGFLKILFMILDDKEEAELRRQNRQMEKKFKRRQKELARIEKAQADAGTGKGVDADAEK